MNSTTETDVSVTLTAGALEAHREAQRLIAAARAWAEQANLLEPPGHIDELAIRRELVEKMERSYYENALLVLTMSQGWDGPLTVWRDTEACWFWRHEKSGYSGGLIFHRDLRYSKPGEPLLVGTWSVHT